MKTAKELIGFNLKRLREAQRWSQAELAEHSRLSLKMIQKLEYGQTNPSTATLDSVSKALGVPLIELFQGARIPATHLSDAALAGLRQEQKASRNRKAAQALGASRTARVVPPVTRPPLEELREIAKYPERYESLYLANLLARLFLGAPESARGLALSLIAEEADLGRQYASALLALVPKLKLK